MALPEVRVNISVATLTSLRERTELNRRSVEELNKSALSRMVWFVAISGFGITGSWQFVEKFLSKPLSTWAGFWISLPWLLAAIFSICTHYSIDEMVGLDNLATNAKLSLLDLKIIDVENKKQVDKEVLQIINDEHKAFKETIKNSNRWQVWANRFERLSLIALIFSFVLSPLIIYFSI